MNYEPYSWVIETKVIIQAVEVEDLNHDRQKHFGIILIAQSMLVDDSLKLP